MNKSRILSVVSTLLFIMTASANASYIYRYTGNNFDGFSSTSAWDASMGVSGMFELPNALGSNLAGSQILPTSFSFTDGMHTITSADMAGDPQLYNVEFSFHTDSYGDITYWSIYLDFGPVGTPFYPGTLGNIGDSLVRIHTTGGLFATAWDIGAVFTCTAINPDSSCATDMEYGDITFSPGTWAVSTVPVPSAVWLFGSGILGLIGFSRKEKAA
jgi:hypothetical protein